VKDARKFIEFLFDAKEDFDFRECVVDMLDQQLAQDVIAVSKTPLRNALKKLGVEVADDHMVEECASIVVKFDTADEYQAALDILQKPESMEVLAGDGWVLIPRGDTGSDVYQARFIELDLEDEPEKKDDKPSDIDKMFKDVADFFSKKPETSKKVGAARESKLTEVYQPADISEWQSEIIAQLKEIKNKLEKDARVKSVRGQVDSRLASYISQMDQLLSIWRNNRFEGSINVETIEILTGPTAILAEADWQFKAYFDSLHAQLLRLMASEQSAPPMDMANAGLGSPKFDRPRRPAKSAIDAKLPSHYGSKRHKIQAPMDVNVPPKL